MIHQLAYSQNINDKDELPPYVDNDSHALNVLEKIFGNVSGNIL